QARLARAEIDDQLPAQPVDPGEEEQQRPEEHQELRQRRLQDGNGLLHDIGQAGLYGDLLPLVTGYAAQAPHHVAHRTDRTFEIAELFAEGLFERRGLLDPARDRIEQQRGGDPYETEKYKDERDGDGGRGDADPVTPFLDGAQG